MSFIDQRRARAKPKSVAIDGGLYRRALARAKDEDRSLEVLVGRALSWYLLKPLETTKGSPCP